MSRRDIVTEPGVARHELPRDPRRRETNTEGVAEGDVRHSATAADRPAYAPVHIPFGEGSPPVVTAG